MMLKRQSELPLSQYSALYDMLIPEDHELRRFLELTDFSFVYQELADKYAIDDGRAAVDPVQMFKYLFLKLYYNLSDRGLIKRAKTDLAFKFFLGLNPEDDVIHPSLLTKFRRLRLVDDELMTKLLEKSVSIAVDNGVLTSKSIIVDATHTTSRFNQYSPVEALRKSSKALRKQLYKADPNIKPSLPEKNDKYDLDAERQYVKRLVGEVKKRPELVARGAVQESMDKLEEVNDDITEYQNYSADHDAKVGHKTADSKFFGYKTHLAVSQEGIITGAIVTSGEKSDGQYLPDLIEQTIDHGMAVEEVTADRAYPSKENLKYTDAHGITLVAKLNPTISQGLRGEDKGWIYNKDAGRMVCPAGHMAINKHCKRHSSKARNNQDVYGFDVEKCKVCSLRDGCYKPGAKSKSYCITFKTPQQEKQMALEKRDDFSAKVKLRYKIEAKNAELKDRHGYRQTWAKDINAMRLQGAITLFCVNLKRIDSLKAAKNKR